MSREGLVGQLKIDRDGEPARRRRRGQGGGRWPLIVGLALVAILVVGAGVWFLIARPDLAADRVGPKSLDIDSYFG